MEKRSLHYKDNKSNKFWTITLDNCSHTVHYGRVGSSGKTETKTFPTLEEAKQSYEKLIQQKLKKGYVEVSEDTQPQLETTAQVIEHPSITQPAEPTAIPEKLEITRLLNLSHEDWRWATWRQRNPLPRSQPKPFDLEDALKRLLKMQPKRRSEKDFLLDWSKAEISISLTPQEADFWLVAMTCGLPENSWGNGYSTYLTVKHLEYLASRLATQSFTGNLTFSEIFTIIYICSERVSPHIVLPVFNLLPFMELVITIHNIQFLNNKAAEQKYVKSIFDAACFERYCAQYPDLSREQILQGVIQKFAKIADERKFNAKYLIAYLIEGFKKFIWSYLTDAEIKEMQDQLRPVLNARKQYHKLYHFAAFLGMHDEVQRQIETWQHYQSRGHIQMPNSEYLSMDDAIELVWGLGNSQLVNKFVRHLNISLNKPDYIRAWLAHTEYSALDWVCKSILKQYNYRDSQVDLLKTFTQAVKAPEAAPYMLELWLSLKKPQLARQWLEDNPVDAIVGLIPVAAGKHTPIEIKLSEMTRAALEFLRSLKRKGYESLILAAVERESPEIADKIRAEIFEKEDISYVPFDNNNTPEWLQTLDISRLKKLNSNPIPWVSYADLPPLVVGNNCLNDEQVNACLLALWESTLDSPHPLVQNLKITSDRSSVDNFIWSLFERWLTEGAPPKEKWAMMALGLLGWDQIALKLTPLIRTWPGENQHPRAVLGLECLRAIGSDTALMQINGIAQKIKYQGLKQRAIECLQAIARDRNLTSEQLEDRIIPDFGLDRRGNRIFDFGTRQFHFVLAPDLKPMVKDGSGKIKDNLPKPGVNDDAEKANQAIADWKLLKKQISQTIKIQSVRLEQAMITERRWSWQEFETLLAHHPFMTHLVQRLVWAGYATDNQLISTFRLAEDQTYADANDRGYDPEAIATVGIIHPIHLTAEQRTAWSEAFSDYEIIPPFPQIDREIYTLQPAEREAVEIVRFKDIQISGITLARTMESLGWQRGGLHDHGDYRVHYKYFSKQNVTAIAGDYEHQHVEQSSIYGDDAIDGCLFLAGEHSHPYEYPAPGSWYDKHLKAKHLHLGEVDSLVITEVLRDLHIVTAKRKQ